MREAASLGLEEEADRYPGTPHPRTAGQLIGHADRQRELLDAYRQNRLPHAIILGGPAGVGKATLAWRLARFLVANPVWSAQRVADAADLSVGPDVKATAEIASLSHPDVSLLRRETNEKTKRSFTEIRADDVRRTIGLFQRGPGAGGYRICIVDSAEDLNRFSANALLKLIEEPPPLSLFLLIAHRPGLVLPTIRSRSRLMRLGALTHAEIEAIVRTLGPPWTDLPASDIAAAARQAQGSVHDALRLLARDGIELDRALGRLLERLPAVDWREVHRLADQVAGRDGEAAYEAAMNAIYAWLARKVRGEAAIRSSRALAPLAEAWDKIRAQAREAEALNLDKRPLILAIFTDLATAARSAS